MKMNVSYKVIALYGRRSLLLAALLALLLSLASITKAQSAGAPAPAKPEKNAAAPARTIAASPEATAKPTSASLGKSGSKGAQEGIKVHGHWTIDVRNTDGSLDKHVEFENNLVTTNLSDTAGGSALLYLLLNGSGSFAAPSTPNSQAGGWAINLQAPSGSNGPCAFNISGFANNLIDYQFSPSCGITNVPGVCTAGGAVSPTDCSQGLSATLNNSGTTNVGASNLLGQSTIPTPTGFTLAGTVTASQSGPLGTVETFVFINVPTTGPFGVVAASLVGFEFTAHPITSIPVTQGQSVAVTVTFSFS